MRAGSTPQPLRRLDDGAGAGHGFFGVVRQIERCVEEGVQRIADDLVHHAAVTHDDAGDRVDIAVENGDGRFGAHPFGERQEPLDIGKQSGDHASVACKPDLLWIFDDAADDFRRQMERKPSFDGEPLAIGAGELGEARALESDQCDEHRDKRIAQEGKPGAEPDRDCRPRGAEQEHGDRRAARRKGDDRKDPNEAEKAADRGLYPVHGCNAHGNMTADDLLDGLGFDFDRGHERVGRRQPQSAGFRSACAQHHDLPGKLLRRCGSGQQGFGGHRPRLPIAFVVK